MFWWRLTNEKWFDLILKRIDKYKGSQNINNIEINIFGDGDYREELIEMIWVNKIQSVKYHWRQDKITIEKYILKTDFALMPSRFIETFWLSALEACETWKPVIGFCKWGLEQFILPEYDISKYYSDSEFGQFEKCINGIIDNFDEDTYIHNSHKSARIAKNFTKKKRLKSRNEIVSL
jgi:glycosyltransferase involved in cell wall biosynthesis